MSHLPWRKKKKQHLHVGVQCWLEAKWKDLEPSMSTFLMKMNRFQCTGAGDGMFCFVNVFWCCNLYGNWLWDHQSAEMSDFQREMQLAFPGCHRQRAGAAPRAHCPILFPEEGWLWPQTLLRSQKSICECLRGWKRSEWQKGRHEVGSVANPVVATLIKQTALGYLNCMDTYGSVTLFLLAFFFLFFLPNHISA